MRRSTLVAVLVALAGCATPQFYYPPPQAAPTTQPQALVSGVRWTVPTPDLPPEPIGTDLLTGVPDPGSRSRHERVAGWCLDAIAAGDERLASEIWRDHGSTLRMHLVPIEPGSGGSWNIPVMSSACAYLSGDRTARGVLREYFRRQLDPSAPAFHGGLMGREALSALYWWPAPAIGLVHDRAAATGDQELAAVARAWLRSYVYVLALGAYPVQLGAMPTSVCLPGMRTSIGWDCNHQIAYFYDRAIGRPARLPHDWLSYHELWPARVSSALDLGRILTQDEAARLRQHRNDGRHHAWILERLQELDVRLRVPLRIIRHTDGFASWFAYNVHGSTPPLLATSYRGAWRYCHLWPATFRGEGGRALGSAAARLDGKEIVCSTTNASWQGWTPVGTVRGNVVQARIPVPASRALYDVVIDEAGARYASDASTPPPSPSPPTPPPPPGRPGEPSQDWAGSLRGPVYNLWAIHGQLERGEISLRDALRRINRSARNITNQTRAYDDRRR